MKQKTVCFVSCGKLKARASMPCHQLYIGTPFKKAYRYAVANFDAVAILSAKHGLLHPDVVIAPYDETLNNMTKPDRARWAAKVAAQIWKRYPPDEWDYTYLAGKVYTEGLPPGKAPLAHIVGPGVRNQWLSNPANRVRR